MTDTIIVALITAGFPMVTTTVTAIIQGRTMNRHAAKQSILQLIMEDHMAVSEGKLPTNYQSVLHEFDIYKKAGGNSYVEKRVNEYVRWFEDIQKKEVRE